MHPSAKRNFNDFLNTYVDTKQTGLTLVEVGSQNVNGSLRDLTDSRTNYIGLDFCEGEGVDVVLKDPYQFPIISESADIVVSSSCFEHSEFFWLTFLECMRILKPHGLFYLNAPSNGDFHRYPVDCWRFYPDSGNALSKWGNLNDINCVLLESFTTPQIDDIWNDYVAVFLKDQSYISKFPQRIINTNSNFTNGVRFGTTQILNASYTPEDKEKLKHVKEIISKL